MPNPRKSSAVIASEGKAHKTKAELAARLEAEQSMSTGVKMKERKEVKENPVAHQEFERLYSLLEKIGKNDAIHEPVINRYCMLQAECLDFEVKREQFNGRLEDMEDSDIDSDKKYKLMVEMQKTIIDLDKQVQAKRRMLFDIERENAMTIAAALRSIPKKVNTDESQLAAALRDD
jgi:hypothetical protein